MATKYENYSGSDDLGIQIYGNNWRGQTFTPSTTHEIQEVWLKIRKVNSPGDSLYVEIYAADGSHHPTGAAIASGSNDGSTWNSSYVLRQITLSSTGTVSAGTEYCIIWKSPSSDASNYYQATFDNTSPTYAGGLSLTSTNGGSSWSTNASADYNFEEWGTAAAGYTTFGSSFLYTATNWETSDVFFEIFFKATTGTVFARLYDVDATDSVAGSVKSTASTTFQRYRTATISANLVDGHEYRVQFGAAGADAGEYIGAKLILK